MNQRDTALASLWGRTYRAAVAPVSRTLFDEAALSDARQLRAATDLVTDIPAAHALGWFHWLRYLAMPGQEAAEELSAALNLLTPVFERYPFAVPEPVQRWYLQSEAGRYADDSGPGSVGQTGSGAEPGHVREQLPVFRATVRSVVDAAPASQPDRTRFLLDIALMLRGMAGRSADEAPLAAAAELTLAALGRGQATLPPPTDIHPGAALQAFLEPVSGPVAAKPLGAARQEETALPQRPAARSAGHVEHAPAPGPAPSADQEYAALSPEVAAGFSRPEDPGGGRRYPGRRAEPPSGVSPYAAFGGAGYGDGGYRDPGYQRPSQQDAGTAGTRTVRGFVEPGQGQLASPEAGYAQPGYSQSSTGPYGHPGFAESSYVAGGSGVAYPPAAEADHRADLYQQPWDYDQPLRYDGEEDSGPGQGSGWATGGYGPGGTYGGQEDDATVRYPPPAYDPAAYNGSGYSAPGINGPGYDLSGIIGTGDFEAVGYEEPGYGRLSYDDPRYDGAPQYPGSPARPGESRFNVPRYDETRLDNLWQAGQDVRSHHDTPGGGVRPVRGALSRSGETSLDAPRYDETRLDSIRAGKDVRRAGGAGRGGDRHGDGRGAADEPSARFLTGMLPESAPAGRQISLVVQVTLAGQPGASAPLKPMAVPPGGCSITITVTARGLVPRGDLERDLHVPAAADSEPILFGFTTGRAGLHQVVVRAFAAGTFVGELGLQVSVEAGGVLEEGPVRTAALAGLVAEPGEVTLQVSRTDEDRYSFQLIGEAFYPVQLTRRLAGDPAEVVRALTEELRAMAAQESRYASAALVRNRIRSLGAQLWADVVPETIRRQYWEQAGRIKLFTVASDMDTVPWELLYPIDGGNDNGFLVEQFPVVRRVYGQSRARHLALSSAAYVVPPGSPANAIDEVEMVKARLGGAVRHHEVCSQLETLLGILDNSPSVLHFACHNEFTDRAGSKINLNGGPFLPSDLTPARLAGSMASSSPLVFLNACRTAGEIPGLMEMMGWAKQFMGAGAGAFIGSLWAVRSSSAKAFADTFYNALISKAAPLGEASLLARQAIAADGGDPTWLAYTVYGNPSATIQ